MKQTGKATHIAPVKHIATVKVVPRAQEAKRREAIGQ